MLRKLLSVALLALGMGLGVARAPGAGSELRGWCIEAKLPRAPGLLRAHGISTPASDGPAERAGDRLRDATCPVRADRLRDGHAAEDDQHGPERRGRVGPRGGLHGPAAGLPHDPARGPVHGPAAGRADRLEGRDLHGLPARARDPPGDPDVHGLSARARDDVQDVYVQRQPPGPRGQLQGRLLHGLPARAGDRDEDGQLHGLPARSRRRATRPARTPSAGPSPA